MFRRIALFIALLCAAPSFAQFANITDTGVTDISGAPLATGTECFTPVNNMRLPIPAQYPGGTVTKSPKCSAITNGVMQPLQLVKSTVTNPVNLCYQRTVTDNSTGRLIIGPGDGYGCVQVSADTNMNTVVPNTPPNVVAVAGPVGPAPVIVSGSTTTLPYTGQASSSVTPLGNSTFALNLAVPQGVPGSVGSQGSVGTLQMAGNGGSLAPSDNTTLINARPVQDYPTISALPLATFHDMLQNAGNQVVNIGLICDSYCIADATVNGPTPALPVPHNLHWVQRFRSLLQTAYGSNGTGVREIVTGSDCAFYDHNWWNGTVSSPSCTGFAGPSGEGSGNLETIPAGATFYFQDYQGENIPWDTFHLYWAVPANGAGAAPTVQVGPTATFPTGTVTATAGSNDVTKTLPSGAVVHRFDTATITAGANTAKVSCPGGGSPCYVSAGQGTLGSTGVNVSNYGIGGGASGMFGADSVDQLAFMDLVPGGFQLLGIGHLQNEPGQGESIAQFTSDLTNITNHFRAYASPPSVYVWSTINCGISGVDPYYPVLQAFSQSANTAYIDERSHLPEYPSNGSPYCGDGKGSFNGHPSVGGNALEFGLTVAGLLNSSLPPTPVGSCSSGQVMTGFTALGVSCASVVGVTVSTCGGAVPSGAVANWSGADGSGSTLSDLVSGNTATFTSAPSWGTLTGTSCPVPTYSGGNYAVAASGASTNFSSNSAFSISTWVDISALQTFTPINGNFDGSTGYLLGLTTGGQPLMQIIQSGGGTISLQSPNPLSAGTLYNIIVTYSGGNSSANFAMYINGAAVTGTVGGTSLTGGLGVTTNPFHIGSFTSSSYPFLGQQFGTVIFNRALTSTEASTIANSGVR